ncbi:MAG: NAD(P)-dependent oxidoreductase [Paludibacteraceae bacterium]|nr:NAD(P)-dependent oxidoreductase [Paludibacteraceae bacterium]
MTKILITGSAGMIGSCVVKELLNKGYSIIGADRRELEYEHEHLKQVVIDLADKKALDELFDREQVDRCIHLAALAHFAGENDLSLERFMFVNVTCAENVFEACAAHEVPILFISTVDAIGMVKGLITPETKLNPISNYGKSKAIAEERLKAICQKWNIYRFSPVYTSSQTRDIEKRYYLKSPNWAYKIGKGEKFEVLEMSGAVKAMVDWADKEVDNTIHIIKDAALLDVNTLIAHEKAQGRAKHVLWIPKWLVLCGYYCIKAIFGNSNKTYLVFKALWPFRTLER